MSAGNVSTAAPIRLRSFDPFRAADLEYRAWVGYYRRQWLRVLTALVQLIRVNLGLDWFRAVHGAWLLLRAAQHWAPYPDNHPDQARACMRRFYALVRLAHGEPANPAKAAELEVEWWRVHREGQRREGQRREGQRREGQRREGRRREGQRRGGSQGAPAPHDAEPAEELVASLTRLYCYLYDEPEAVLRPAAAHRARAMDLSDRWVREGCRPGSRLLPLEHAALVRSYAALLSAVHR